MLTVINSVLTFGKAVKRLPAKRMTTTRIEMENTEVSWVRPPTATCTLLRDIEAPEGRHQKNEPKTLETP